MVFSIKWPSKPNVATDSWSYFHFKCPCLHLSNAMFSLLLNLMSVFPLGSLRLIHTSLINSFQNQHLQNICKIKSKSSNSNQAGWSNRHLSYGYYNTIWNCSNWLICIIRYTWANFSLCALNSNFTTGCTSPSLLFKQYKLVSFNLSIRAVKNFHTNTVNIITSWHKMH